ncbi:cell division-specific peptidoglycan biosynthesis regulator FtsW [Spongiibacter sp. IMCC21906]|jgi:cell division protein FtsW|uniref:putative lipid II flippase FtsW n=1 Tax=Spongiibacter sp. IMCC21906 TaxID=1620392 RepID=UPI00062DFF44|nr:putative lipid II flippase FtsW [Spongiibacter sp. IMCC21906]AKH68894.1 cell division-specific peptidoglycan biosynthesis regulator FtsW [Spongiibacter sp. IMCC21906]
MTSMVSQTWRELQSVDRVLQLLLVALLFVGFVAMVSASVEHAAGRYGDAFFFAKRYFFHFSIALVVSVVMYLTPIDAWERSSWLWLLIGFVLLALVLVPGVGREVNGSRRWLALGPLTLQASEFVKLFVIFYLAGYLVRRKDEVQQRWSGFIKPMAVLFAVTLLLMLEPDFGATVVTAGTAFVMIFLGGVKLGQFMLVILSCVAGAVAMVIFEPYRMQRLTAFTDPWADQFNSGYQLTQSLIAFGRGEIIGVGLGNSVQKLFYLPEAHTDFVFAIFAEEFGFLGTLLMLGLFVGLIGRILHIGRHAEMAGKHFHAYVAYGIAVMISGQAFINMGVNIGLLPTKGLTLPFISYGGSSLIVCLAMVAIVARIERECRGKYGR